MHSYRPPERGQITSSSALTPDRLDGVPGNALAKHRLCGALLGHDFARLLACPRVACAWCHAQLNRSVRGGGLVPPPSSGGRGRVRRDLQVSWRGVAGLLEPRSRPLAPAVPLPWAGAYCARVWKTWLPKHISACTTSSASRQRLGDSSAARQKRISDCSFRRCTSSSCVGCWPASRIRSSASRNFATSPLATCRPTTPSMNGATGSRSGSRSPNLSASRRASNASTRRPHRAMKYPSRARACCASTARPCSAASRLATRKRSSAALAWSRSASHLACQTNRKAREAPIASCPHAHCEESRARCMNSSARSILTGTPAPDLSVAQATRPFVTPVANLLCASPSAKSYQQSDCSPAAPPAPPSLARRSALLS